ncbi:MAG: DinB family protein [Nitrospinota bacterium]
MRAAEFLIRTLKLAQGTMDVALDGLTAKDLAYRPDGRVNTIGFLLWHMSREEDYVISEFEARSQVWVSQGWHKKFGRPADSEETGYGFTPEEVGEFQFPPLRTLKGYQSAVRKETLRYLRRRTDEDFDAAMARSVAGQPTLGGQLGILTSEILQHTGQIAYLKGILAGFGWRKGWQ